MAKGAVVLTAASLERYVNELLAEKCRSLQVADWNSLSEGQKQYLSYQMAQRARGASLKLAKRRDLSGRARERLKKAVTDCVDGFNTPSSWTHHRDYGMFMDGAAEPDRIDGTLRLFIPTGQGIFDLAEARGRDRAALATALSGLVDARHRVAHALPGASPGPTDSRVWLVLTRVLVREIEAAFP
jgi:hypothetical protein